MKHYRYRALDVQGTLRQGRLSSPDLASLEQALARQGLTLLRAHPGLTERELDVCARLLQGMTQEGIACDLGLSLPTVKTYRNRAFSRLGIHFRNELFALALGTQRNA